MEAHHNIPIGTKVRMSEAGKRKWKESFSNPYDREGVVCKHKPPDEFFLPYSVKWSNGSTNSYQEGDLNPIQTFTIEDFL